MLRASGHLGALRLLAALSRRLWPDLAVAFLIAATVLLFSSLSDKVAPASHKPHSAPPLQTYAVASHSDV